MRNYFLLSGFMLITLLPLKAQDTTNLRWLSDGTTWYHTIFSHNWGGEYYYGYVKTVVTGDSVIEGQNVKLLSQEVVYKDSRYIGQNPMFLYNEGNRVYYQTFNPFFPEERKFSLLYDFDAVQGDTIWVHEPWQDYESDDLIPVIIDSTYTVEINGQILPAMQQRMPGYVWLFSGESVKYIGLLDHLLPKSWWTLDLAYDIIGLRCFSSGNFSWQTDPDVPCDTLYTITVSTDDPASQGKPINLFPNPGQSFLNIAFENNPGSEIISLVSDMQGKLLLKEIYGPEKNIRINIQSLTPGTYHLRIISDKKVFDEVFIKE